MRLELNFRRGYQPTTITVSEQPDEVISGSVGTTAD